MDAGSARLGSLIRSADLPAVPDLIAHLEDRLERACRHLLSHQDRDPESPTRGCFDRRFWGWKLVDFPEATFQRNVYPLTWLWRRVAARDQSRGEVLLKAVLGGLHYTRSIQHRDGSFDQAFPQEHSFGATAFLLQSLAKTWRLLAGTAGGHTALPEVRETLVKAADFLCRHDERHGHIANHLAGAALGLAETADLFGDFRHGARAAELVERILDHQSPEGWFLEYNGADPGYQTLCLYYLASYARLRPSPRLQDALDRAVQFLSWFIHPDGTFAGEYGSRRTATFYPGGVAILARENLLARRMLDFMMRSIAEQRTITTNEIDFGNQAPLLSNYAAVIDEQAEAGPQVSPAAPVAKSVLPFEQERLPCERQGSVDFPEAGLYVRSGDDYYAVFGASNGGVLKVFDHNAGRLLSNDSGYVGRLVNGGRVTTQFTQVAPACAVDGDSITFQAPFYQMAQAVPSPLLFLALRFLNLTVMRSLWLGNVVKRLMVRSLITGNRKVPLQLERSVHFQPDRVIVRDRIMGRMTGKARLLSLVCGRPFVAIHMASARYFEGFASAAADDSEHIDVDRLHASGAVEREVEICPPR